MPQVLAKSRRVLQDQPEPPDAANASQTSTRAAKPHDLDGDIAIEFLFAEMDLIDKFEVFSIQFACECVRKRINVARQEGSRVAEHIFGISGWMSCKLCSQVLTSAAKSRIEQPGAA